MPEERKFQIKDVGLLSGVINERIDRNGNLRACMFCKQNKISFHGEIYIPKYGTEDFRTRYRDAVTFYKTGELKSVYLEKQQEINSPIGKMKAELVTFYKSGSILRIFPVYGQISGYWSEREESKLLQTYIIETGTQRIEAKISGISFYETGAVKSITLFPGEVVTVNTPAGTIRARYGISFFENGTIESVEPDKQVSITYDTCKFSPYDNHPIGIHGDKNSLGFYEDGALRTLKTTITSVIFSNENEEILIKPESRISQTDIDQMEIVPITLEFYDKVIRVTDSDGFVHDFGMEQYRMETKQIWQNLYKSEKCTDCNSCSNCEHKEN